MFHQPQEPVAFNHGGRGDFEAANGVIIAQAGRFGGWSLYLKDGKPTYCYNFLSGWRNSRSASPQALAAGKATVRMNFDYDGGSAGKAARPASKVNGEKVASGRIERTQMAIFSADETAGSAWMTPRPSRTTTRAGQRFHGQDSQGHH